MKIHASLLAMIVAMALTGSSLAATKGETLPFTEDEDFDGARTVWLFFNSSGIPGTKHAYVPAKEIPKSNRWLKLDSKTPLQIGDMAWWPNAMAILRDKEKEKYIFKNKIVTLTALEERYGKPEFRRFNKAEKPLALVVFRKDESAGKIPAVLPKSELYDTAFDLAINTRGPSCTHNTDDVYVSIADTDENKIYEIDYSGCITGEEREIDLEFFEVIKTMQKNGVFD